MKTIVKYLSGVKFNPSTSCCDRKCYRCGASIIQGELRMEFASVVTSRESAEVAELSWSTFCEDCSEDIKSAAAKKMKAAKLRTTGRSPKRR